MHTPSLFMVHRAQVSKPQVTTEHWINTNKSSCTARQSVIYQNLVTERERERETENGEQRGEGCPLTRKYGKVTK